jgi:mono/diheme cytochrome c family protein
MAARVLLRLAAATLAMTAGPLSAADGEQLYQQSCAACHQTDGTGVPTLAPPLHGALWSRLGPKAPDYLAHTMLAGMAGQELDGENYYSAMPSWAALGDAELAAIGSYILQQLNDGDQQLTPELISAARKQPVDGARLKRLREGQAP